MCHPASEHGAVEPTCSHVRQLADACGECMAMVQPLLGSSACASPKGVAVCPPCCQMLGWPTLQFWKPGCQNCMGPASVWGLNLDGTWVWMGWWDPDHPTCGCGCVQGQANRICKRGVRNNGLGRVGAAIPHGRGCVYLGLPILWI